MISNLCSRNVAIKSVSRRSQVPMQRFTPGRKMMTVVRSEAEKKDYANDASNAFKNTVNKVAGDISAAASGFTEEAKKTTKNVQENVEQTADDAKKAASNTAEDVKSGAKDAGNKADKATKPHSEKVLDGLNNIVDEGNVQLGN